MISELRTAIVAKAVTVSGITASNVFYAKAPDNKTGLHVVFFGQPYERGWDSLAHSEKIPVQFNFYSTVQSTLSAATIAFKAAFDFATLTVANYTFVSCLPGIPTLPLTKIDDVWQEVLTYNIEITKLRS